jgi:predicted CoA-binding protein
MRPGVEEFLAERRVAVVGVSRGRGFGNAALRELRRRGYEVLPVNAAADCVEGERCWRSLAELPEKPGAVLVVVPPDQAVKVVAECARLGISRVWLQQGSESPEAVALAQAHGVGLVHGACILMYANPGSIHRCHRWVERVRGRL